MDMRTTAGRKREVQNDLIFLTGATGRVELPSSWVEKDSGGAVFWGRRVMVLV